MRSTRARIFDGGDAPIPVWPSPPSASRPASRAIVLAGLVWTLVRTDFKARYHGSIGGFIWALLKPLAMFLVLLSVFSLHFGSNPDYKLNLIIGLFLWDFFAESTRTGLTSLQARGYLLTKSKFPSWLLVVTSISNAAITLAVFTVVIVAFLVASGRPPGLLTIAAFLFYCVALATIVVGFALATSVLFLRYRDLNQVWDVVSQAGFFIAPIIYPLGIVPERWHIYLYIWPPTPIVEFSRLALVAGVLPSATAHVLLIVDAAVALLLGMLIYARLSPRAAEYV